MGRWCLTLILPLSLVATVAAVAEDRGPVCREPSVVDEMTRQIRRWDYYAHVQPQLVTEQPTADPRFVRCEVCVQLAPYSMTLMGDQPIRYCVAHGFEVNILPAGFIVRDLR